MLVTFQGRRLDWDESTGPTRQTRGDFKVELYKRP